jgi:Amt family ammonium transporter
LDDTLDVFPCHGIGGIVGMVLTSVFARDVGLLTGETATFYAHLVSLVGVIFGVCLISYVLYWLVNFITPMRVSASDEILGLDISQHNEIGLSLEEIAALERAPTKRPEFLGTAH